MFTRVEECIDADDVLEIRSGLAQHCLDVVEALPGLRRAAFVDRPVGPVAELAGAEQNIRARWRDHAVALGEERCRDGTHIDGLARGGFLLWTMTATMDTTSRLVAQSQSAAHSQASTGS